MARTVYDTGTTQQWTRTEAEQTLTAHIDIALLHDQEVVIVDLGILQDLLTLAGYERLET